VPDLDRAVVKTRIEMSGVRLADLGRGPESVSFRPSLTDIRTGERCLRQLKINSFRVLELNHSNTMLVIRPADLA
jgi:hypothetical protein